MKEKEKSEAIAKTEIEALKDALKQSVRSGKGEKI